MKEILNNYEYPVVVDNTIVIKNKNGGESIHPFDTANDAKRALEFARLCQMMGIALRVDRKIMIKKS